ncbi:MAG: sensor histidine kinase, partial [Desulfuromonadales bacterium]
GFDVDLTRRSLAQYAPHVTLEAVASGAEVLKRLPLTSGETSPTCDVLLLDFRLPDLNAIEVAKIVRLERGLQIPIVMVTGHGNEELVVQALRLGVDDYLIKNENYLQQLPYVLEKVWKQGELRRSEARYRTLFEANPHPMWVYDLETLAFLAVNDAAIAHYGYCREEFLAMTINELRPAEDVPKLLESLDLGKEGLDSVSVWRHRKKDGTLVDVDIRTHTLQFDGRRAKMVLAYDVTEQRRAEQERKKLIDELEKRNAELERFTYTVSHDLKSPLVTILGFIGQLEYDLAKNDPHNVKADLDFIGNAANQMRDLLDSLLKLSRAGRAIGEPRPVDLPALVRQVIEQVGDRLAHVRLQVGIPPELPAVQGDAIRLFEVFQNLLENAAKFTAGQPDPCIEIGCAIGEREILCHVRDNGIGIPAEYQKKVFGLFEQLDPRKEGTGIGLAIVRRIVEEHGGRVWVESAGSGQGSTFYCTLPV